MSHPLDWALSACTLHDSRSPSVEAEGAKGHCWETPELQSPTTSLLMFSVPLLCAEPEALNQLTTVYKEILKPYFQRVLNWVWSSFIRIILFYPQNELVLPQVHTKVNSTARDETHFFLNSKTTNPTPTATQRPQARDQQIGLGCLKWFMIIIIIIIIY